MAGSIQFEGNQSISDQDLSKARVQLSEQDGQFVPVPRGAPVTLSELRAESLSADAVDAVIRAISALYQDAGLLAVRVTVTRDAYEAALAGQDLIITVTEGRVNEARVVSTDSETAVPARVAQRILEGAPVSAGDNLDGAQLDRSIGLMNRYSPDYVRPVLLSGPTGQIELEYRVAVGEKLSASYAIDNYGSDSSGELRHSVEAQVNRLFTAADHVKFSGSLAHEEDTFFLRGAYFLPLDGMGQNRLRLSAYRSEFNSEDIGLARLDFSGETTGAILGFERTLWSNKGSYLDLSLGLQYMHANQDNSSVGITEEDSDFLLPFADLTLSKSEIDHSWVLGLKLEGNLAGLADTGDAIELARMGRLNAEPEFITGSVFTGLQTYLDPTFSDTNRRIHELLFSGTAKSSFGDRLPANFLNVLGGANTVRGYSVAAASGDASLYAQLDYRIHLNRSFQTTESASDYRLNPRFSGDMPPVDLALGFFTDYGQIDTVDELAFEDSGDLWSAGLGFYGKASRHLTVSAEYGWILTDYETASDIEESGDGKFYFSAEFRF